jgi:hypothetical protein
MQTQQKTCPVCGRSFDAHPNATYCDITCANRAAYRRRSQRRFRKSTAPSSPYQFIYDNVTADQLAQIYTDIQTHVYERDIRINGALPLNVPRPADVHLITATDHHLAYHASRELILDSPQTS